MIKYFVFSLIFIQCTCRLIPWTERGTPQPYIYMSEEEESPQELQEKNCFIPAELEGCYGTNAKLVLSLGDKTTTIDMKELMESENKFCLPVKCISNKDDELELSDTVFVGGTNVEPKPAIIIKQGKFFENEAECKGVEKPTVTVECRAIDDIGLEVDPDTAPKSDDSKPDLVTSFEIETNKKDIGKSQWLHNWFQGDMSTLCPPRHALYWVISAHDNYYEDRVFEFHCKNLQTDRDFNHCYWTGYQAGFDQPSFQNCGANYVLHGMYSQFHGHFKDRRFNLLCCHTETYHTESCSLSDYVNGWDTFMNYQLPPASTRVFSGFYSYHDNGTNDRRFKILDCFYQKNK